MRLRPFSNLGRAPALCLLLTLAANAQSPQTEPPVKLSAKVAIGAHGVPSFYPLPDADGKEAGASYGVRPLASAGVLSGPPVDTVTVRFVRQGSRARAAVYAHRGGGEKRENLKVAECLLGEWQECEATGLAAYGVEPFRLSVVRRVEVKLTPPRFDSRLQAVEVSEIKVHPEVPSFELVLRNASEKEIRAVEIEEYRGWMPKGAPPMYDWKRTAPVKPGKTFSVTLEFGWNGKETPEGHAVEPPDRVHLKSVLFTDGTYEGSSLFAARAEALREGRRAQLKRVLEMIGELGEGFPDYSFVRGLVSRVEMLESTADWSAVNAFAERYRVTGGEELELLKSQIESGMQLQRGSILNDLNAFLQQVSLASDPAETQRRLKLIRESYEKRLSDI